MMRDAAMQRQWTKDRRKERKRTMRATAQPKQRKKVKAQSLSFTHIIVVSILILFLSAVLLRETKISALNKEITALEQEVVDLTAEKDSLAKALAPYEAQDRIEKMAKGALNMDYPTKKQISYVGISASPTVTEAEEEITFAEKAAGFIFGLFRY